MMDDKKLERINAVRATMGTTGWQHLLDDWRVDLQNLEKQVVYKSEDFGQVTFARGAITVLHRLLNLAQALDAAEAAAKEKNNDEG